MASFYQVCRLGVRLVLRCYFRRIEHFHPERVPPAGPVLFVCNHPNSLTDAFVIGTAVARKVHFVATVQLFRLPMLKWALLRCGVVPVNRQADDPRGMRTVLHTFAACHEVLEQGGAIGIFPEGITHDDPQLKPVKTGPARIALELEHRWKGQLGLKILPAGLTFTAKEKFRSTALVHFGEPIPVAGFISGYGEHRKECIQRLSEQIERSLQSLIVHVRRLEHARVVEGVKRLYLDTLRLGNVVISEPLAPAAEELVLTQTVAGAVEFAFNRFPERASRFARKLHHYEGWLNRLHLHDQAVIEWPNRTRLFTRHLPSALLTVLGAPIALYGAVHSLLPLTVVRQSVRRFARPEKQKARVATVAILSGTLSFGAFYSLFVVLVHWLAGWPWSLVYACSLPLASFFAYFYFRQHQRLEHSLRHTIIGLRGPVLARRLAHRRAELIEEIESIRAEYRATLLESRGQTQEQGPPGSTQ